MYIQTDAVSSYLSDLPPMFVPPVTLVRQARGQGR